MLDPHQDAGSGSQPKLDCRSAMQQLWDYVDGELTPDRLAAVERHLTACSHCHPHVEFAERFLKAVHETRLAGGCPEETRKKVMEQLRAAGLTAC
jgi:anti-sigma factor (TIGR02949 family)